MYAIMVWSAAYMGGNGIEFALAFVFLFTRDICDDIQLKVDSYLDVSPLACETLDEDDGEGNG
jgi:hypothetical protein